MHFAGTFFVVVLCFVLLLFYKTLLIREKSSETCVPALTYTPRPMPPPPTGTIPVWMYWHSEDVPETVKLCLASWKRNCAASKFDFKVIFVHDDNLSSFVDNSMHSCLHAESSHTALKADIIRLMLLEKYGGVYIDASVVMTRPLDWILGDDGDGRNYFQAFFNQKNMNISCNVAVVENSFLASPPGLMLIRAWLRKLLTLPTCEVSEIKKMTKHMPIQMNLHNTYHFAYHALSSLLVETPIAAFGAYHLYDSNKMKYLLFMHASVDDLLSKDGFDAPGPLLKLISRERFELENALQNDSSSSKRIVKKGSFVDKYLRSAKS